MEFKDYYKILGVDPTADAKEIKLAYRRLARKYHPDMNSEKGAEDKFKEVAEAYEVLKNDQRRAKFDEIRKYGGRKDKGFEPPPGWQKQGQSGSQYNEHMSGDFSDFFNSIFGGQGRSSRANGNQQAQRGQDAEIELPVFLEETISDTQKSIEYMLPVYENGQRKDVKKQLKVTIPQGVIDGERIRLKGQGHVSQFGGKTGDLYLHIRVVPHPIFDVQGHNLVLALPLAPWEAALGTKVTIPTLEGKISVSVPPKTQAGKTLRLKGKGLKGRKSKEGCITGDLLAIIKIVMPSEINEEQKNLWQALAVKGAFDPRAEWGAKK